MSKAAKKKSKVPKLTEAEYAAYVSGLRESGEECTSPKQDEKERDKSAE